MSELTSRELLLRVRPFTSISQLYADLTDSDVELYIELIPEGRLFDREAIDYEAAIKPLQNWVEFMLATAPLEGSDAEWWTRNLLIGATLIVDAALGIGEPDD